MMRAMISGGCLVLCFAGAAALAESDAQQPPPWARWEQRVRQLDLEPEQRDKVQQILDASRKERDEIQGRVRQAAKELNDSLRQPTPNEEQILHQADKLGQLRTERQKAMLRALLQVRAQLTPKQREQLIAMPQGAANTPRWSTRPPAGRTPRAATRSSGHVE